MASTELTERPDEALGEYGPAMRILTEKQREFVSRLVETGCSYTDAARAAGYSGVSANSLRVTGHRLAHDDKVIAAIREEAERKMRAGAAFGVHALEEIARDPTHKDRLRAAGKLLGMAGLREDESRTVHHVHELNDEQLDARIRMLAKRNGLDPARLLGPGKDVIEGTFAVVDPADELKDVL